MLIHLAIQYPLTRIHLAVLVLHTRILSRKNASRHLQMPQGVPFIHLVHQALAKLCAKWNCVNNSNNLHKP